MNAYVTRIDKFLKVATEIDKFAIALGITLIIGLYNYGLLGMMFDHLLDMMINLLLVWLFVKAFFYLY